MSLPTLWSVTVISIIHLSDLGVYSHCHYSEELSWWQTGSGFVHLSTHSDYNSNGGGVTTTASTACLSGSRIPYGFLPQLAGRLHGSNLLLFKQTNYRNGLCWLLQQANTLNFSLLISLQCYWKHSHWKVLVVYTCPLFALCSFMESFAGTAGTIPFITQYKSARWRS